MKKHVLAILLAVALIVSMLPTTVMATEEVVSTNPYKSASLTLTGKPTLVLKYEPQEGDSTDTLTTVFDVDGSEPVTPVEADGLYIFEIEVTAARLYSPIKATLYKGETEAGSCEFVLADYAEKVKAIDPACSDLLNSLIAYSNYAAAYNGAADTKDINAVQAITALSGYNSVAVMNEITGIGVVPILNDACDLYFTFPEGIDAYTVKVNDQEVELMSTEGGVLNTAKPYCYAIKEILPQNWADPYVVEVYDGETLKTQFSYSVLSYVQRKLGAEDETLANLLKAMYIYHRDAEMYARTEARGTADGFASLDGWTLPTADTATQPSINADGQLEFAVTETPTDSAPGNYVSKAISGDTGTLNSSTTVIDVDFTVGNSSGFTASTEIAILKGDSPLVRITIQNGALRHYPANVQTYVAHNNKEKYPDIPSFSLDLNAVHHARVVLDLLTQKYDLYINGVLWISKAQTVIAFDCDDVLSLRLGIFNNGTGVICFDNLQVSKLNPSAVDLTTVGLKKTLYTEDFEDALNTDTNKDNGYRWPGPNTTIKDGKLYLDAGSAQQISRLYNSSKSFTNKFAIEFDVESSVINSTYGPYVSFKYRSSSATEYLALRIYADKVQHGSDRTETKGIYFSADSFYHVMYVVDIDNHTYEVYINGQSVGSGTFSSACTAINDIFFQTIGYTTGMIVQYDNLKISQILTPAQ